LINQKRLELVERQQVAVVLRELQLSPMKLVDPATVARIGRIVAAESLLIGAVLETPQALEVFVHFVDVATAVVLAAEDIYAEDLNLRAVVTLMEGLPWQFRQRFPLLEGVVVKTEGKRVFVDLGSKQAIKTYLKLLLFRAGEAVKHPDTGKILGAPTETQSEARIEVVLEEISQATPLEPTAAAAGESWKGRYHISASQKVKHGRDSPVPTASARVPCGGGSWDGSGAPGNLFGSIRARRVGSVAGWTGAAGWVQRRGGQREPDAPEPEQCPSSRRGPHGWRCPIGAASHARTHQALPHGHDRGG